MPHIEFRACINSNGIFFQHSCFKDFTSITVFLLSSTLFSISTPFVWICAGLQSLGLLFFYSQCLCSVCGSFYSYIYSPCMCATSLTYMTIASTLTPSVMTFPLNLRLLYLDIFTLESNKYLRLSMTKTLLYSPASTKTSICLQCSLI